MVDDGHWVRWHAGYDDPASSLSRRLAVVQRRLGDALDQAEDGPIKLISMCAGQGRDVIEVLRGHRRRDDVVARLVELDPDLVAHARATAEAAGLLNVEVVRGDAATTAAYQGSVPADVVLVCGVFGNVSDHDVHATVLELPRLCAAGASVIWTRHRRPPDLTPAIGSWFVEAGFEAVAFDSEEGAAFAVGTYVSSVPPFRSAPITACSASSETVWTHSYNALRDHAAQCCSTSCSQSTNAMKRPRFGRRQRSATSRRAP